MFQLILGSGSPRRRELLQWTFLNFKVHVSSIEEVSYKSEPKEIVQDLAFQKAKQVYLEVKKNEINPFVLGADTIVVINNKILGKPKGREDAKAMLLELSDQVHSVLTGVCFYWDDQFITFFDETEVFFDKIEPDLLDFYLDTNESLDKAGAYGIQGAALGFIQKIEGSYSNVVGLPVDKVITHLKTVLGEGFRKCFIK